MKVPDRSDKIWENIIMGKVTIDFEFLAINILLTRMKSAIKLDPSPVMIKNSSNELHDMFEKNVNLPKVQNDLKKIIDSGGIK